MELKYSAEGLLEDGLHVLSERGKQYDPQGKTERSMEKIVAAFKIITGKKLTEAEGWMFMAILKQVRSFQRKGFHADSAQDFVCYSALYGEAKAKEGGPQGEVLCPKEQREKHMALHGLGIIHQPEQKLGRYVPLKDMPPEETDNYLKRQLSAEALNELRSKAFEKYKAAAIAMQIRCSSSWFEMHPTEQKGWLMAILTPEVPINAPIIDPTIRKKDPTTGLDLPI